MLAGQVGFWLVTQFFPSKVPPLEHVGDTGEIHDVPLKVKFGAQVGRLAETQLLPSETVSYGHYDFVEVSLHTLDVREKMIELLLIIRDPCQLVELFLIIKLVFDI